MSTCGFSLRVDSARFQICGKRDAVKPQLAPSPNGAPAPVNVGFQLQPAGRVKFGTLLNCT